MRILDSQEIGQVELEFEKLHGVVGLSIATHQLGPNTLPTKGKGKIFDWTLGPEIGELAEKHEADYALFIYYRDIQASDGRIALAFLAAAAGVYMQSGSEYGFASLVDLRTGDVVWFNRVVAGSGELRTERGANSTVDTLFRNFPQSTNSGRQ